MIPEGTENECSGLVGSIMGHKFEARFHKHPPTHNLKFDYMIDTRDVVSITNAYSKREYVRDVCVRCGMVVKNDK